MCSQFWVSPLVQEPCGTCGLTQEFLWSDGRSTRDWQAHMTVAWGFGWGVSVLLHLHSPAAWLGSSPEAAGFQESKSESWMLLDTCTMSPLPQLIGSNKSQDLPRMYSLVKLISHPDRRKSSITLQRNMMPELWEICDHDLQSSTSCCLFFLTYTCWPLLSCLSFLSWNNILALILRW